MIYLSKPSDWKDLQAKIAEVFSDIGCETYIEKDIGVARGKVNIDVFVIDSTYSPSTKLICECKYWEKPIPQSVIHAFRTVVSDAGAHHGIIISKNGFQSGAYEAIENSNVKLLTWDEFQNEFYNRWIESMIRRVQNLRDSILEISDIEDDERKLLAINSDENIKQQYLDQVKLATMYMGSIMGSMINIKELTTPILFQDFKSIKNILSFDSKKNAFNYVLSSGEELVSQFENLWKAI